MVTATQQQWFRKVFSHQEKKLELFYHEIRDSSEVSELVTELEEIGGFFEDPTLSSRIREKPLPAAIFLIAPVVANHELISTIDSLIFSHAVHLALTNLRRVYPSSVLFSEPDTICHFGKISQETARLINRRQIVRNF